MFLAQWPGRFVMYLLGATSIRILVLAACAALLAWALRRRGPETRHAVWLLVLGAMLLMPVLTVVVPPRFVAPLSWAPVPLTAPSEVPLRVQSRTVMTVTASGQTMVEQGADAVRRALLPDWSRFLFVGYCLIALLAALRVGHAVRRAGRLMRAAEEIRDDELHEVLRGICLEQGTGYPLPAVRESKATLVPFTAGWQDPTILLPSDWREWDSFKLRAVLAHEMAHIRRGDWLIALMAAVNRTLFWFHPLAWWLERKLADLAEEACDSAAIGRQGDSRRYASVVLEFAMTMTTARSRLSWEATAMARSSRIGGRIERILEGRMRWSASMTTRGWALLLALAFPVLYAASALQPFQPPPLPASTLAPLPPFSTEVAGGDMTAADAAALEQRIARNPKDVDARLLITGYYFRNALMEPYRQQLSWMVENAPESVAHDTYAFSVTNNGSLMIDDAEREKLADLWRKQAALHPADSAVLVHAGRFFMDRDPETGVQLYLRAREVAPADLSCVEELVMLHLAALNKMDAARIPAPEVSQKYQRMVAALESINDPEVLGRSGIRLGSSLFSHPPEGVPASVRQWLEETTRKRRALARNLLDRAHALAPADERWVKALARFDAGEGLLEQPGAPEQPVSSRAPDYPPLAKLGRVQGRVMLQVSVRSDGSVSEASLMSGHPLLAQAALEAVRSWTFAVRPTEQRITTMVEFKLPGDAGHPAGVTAPPVQSGSTTSGGVPSRITVGANVQKAMLVESPEPVYPPLARQARISGTVRFDIIIAKDGSIANMTLVAGHPLLIQAAKEAVQAYRYKPTRLNGNPVEVATSVDVPFTLSN